MSFVDAAKFRNATHMINALVADGDTSITDIIRNVLRSNSSSVEPRSSSQPSAEASLPTLIQSFQTQPQTQFVPAAANIPHKHKDEQTQQRMTASVNAAASAASTGEKSSKSGTGSGQQGSASTTTTTNVWEQRMARQKEKELREKQEAVRAGSDRSTSSPRTISEPSAMDEPSKPQNIEQPPAVAPQQLPNPIGPPNKEKSGDEESPTGKKANKPEPIRTSPTVPLPVLPEVTPNTSLPYTPLSAPNNSQTVQRNISTDSVLTPTGHDLTDISFLDESTHAKLAEIWGPGSEQSNGPAWGGELLLNNFSSLNIASAGTEWGNSTDFLGLQSSSPTKQTAVSSSNNPMYSTAADWSSSLGAMGVASNAEPQKAVGYGRSQSAVQMQQQQSLRSSSQSAVPIMQQVGMQRAYVQQQTGHNGSQDNNVFNQLAAQLLTHQGSHSSASSATSTTVPIPSAASSYYPSPSYTDPSIMGMGLNTPPQPPQPAISNPHHHPLSQAHQQHHTMKSYMANYHQNINDFDSLNSILSGHQHQNGVAGGEFYPPHTSGGSRGVTPVGGPHLVGQSGRASAAAAAAAAMSAGFPPPPPGFGNPNSQPNTSIPPPALRSQFYPQAQLLQQGQMSQASQQLPQPNTSSGAFAAYSNNGSSSWKTNGTQWGAESIRMLSSFARGLLRTGRQCRFNMAATTRSLYIQVQETPNPMSLKFLPGKQIVESGRTYEYSSPKSARESPLAMKLFMVDGVGSVFFGEDFVTVTKKDESVEWAVLRPEIFSAIADFVQSEQKIINENADTPYYQDTAIQPEDDDTVSMIKEILETRIRPMVQEDGGDITYMGFENGTVKLKLKGSCTGCPSSSVTLKSGIQNMLSFYIPEVKDVIEVKDESDDLVEEELSKFEKSKGITD
ncbi:hypothetical protein WR25_06770 [Diploscapter pachys]|uniref:NFU1 iron-sulfur cluster scaffold homolog, mitochondrial n=1 Tax=Diploscapter pachys TaxID=2018661 RepID=A0A2A2J451_9BILA|nr:hypothetical protein WR25_06770 [Diploscapter pachys]